MRVKKCVQFFNFDELKYFLRFRRRVHMNVEIKKRITPVTIAYLRPTFTSKFTRSPANTTPTKFAVTADQNGISRIEAMKAPVHAPVPGKGTATNSIRPSHWNSSTGPAFSLALLNSMSRNRDADKLLPARKDANFFKYSMMKGTGIMFLQLKPQVCQFQSHQSNYQFGKINPPCTNNHKDNLILNNRINNLKILNLNYKHKLYLMSIRALRKTWAEDKWSIIWTVYSCYVSIIGKRHNPLLSVSLNPMRYCFMCKQLNIYKNKQWVAHMMTCVHI